MAILKSLIFVIVVPGIFLFYIPFFVVFYEEPTLQRKFGDSYIHYLQTVPRWIPRTIRQPPK